MEPRPDPIYPAEAKAAPHRPGGIVVLLVAVAWLLIALPLALMVGTTVFLVGILDDWLGPPRAGATTVLVMTACLALSLTAAGIAWLVVQVPNRRTMSISLIVAVVLFGFTIVLHLIDDPITAGLDNIFAGLAVFASAIGVKATRQQGTSPI